DPSDPDRGRRLLDLRPRDHRRLAARGPAALALLPLHEDRPGDAGGGAEPGVEPPDRDPRHLDDRARLGAGRRARRRRRADGGAAARQLRPELHAADPPLRLCRRRARRHRQRARGGPREARTRGLPESARHLRFLDRDRPAPGGGAGGDPRRPAREALGPAWHRRREASMRRARIAAGLLVAAGAGVLVLLLPHWLSDPPAAELARAGCFFIAILGPNLLTGYTGQISLGHGALMAVGAYTTAILTADHGFRDLWTIPLAGVVAMAAGFLLGLPAIRLSGLYLALATFAFGVAMPALLKKFSGLTGGSAGINLFDEALNRSTGALGSVHVLGRTVATNDFLYYLTWGIGLLLAGAAWLLVRGRVGRAFRAVRDSEVAAASSGVNTAFYKTLAFGISGFYAGIGGARVVVALPLVRPPRHI